MFKANPSKSMTNHISKMAGAKKPAKKNMFGKSGSKKKGKFSLFKKAGGDVNEHDYED